MGKKLSWVEYAGKKADGKMKQVKRNQHWLWSGFTLLVCLLMMTGCAMAEGVTVKIPVISHGADCVAVLQDESGTALQEVNLKEGVESFFQVTSEQLGQAHYRLLLKDTKDKNIQKLDETVYDVTMTTYYRPSGEIAALLEIRLSGNTAAPKKEKAEFTSTIKPAYIDPPVKKQVTGSPTTKATFTFVLKAVSNTAGLEEMPMPVAANGKQEMTMNIVGAGEKEFGQIEFTVPGDYVYSISEQKKTISGYTFDTSVYTVTARVTREGNALSAQTMITKGNTEATGIVFTNTYKATTTGTSPHTGDDRNLGWWIGGFIALLCLIIGLAVYYVRSGKKGKER